eukprot:354937-Amphidinium_carterae.1
MGLLANEVVESKRVGKQVARAFQKPRHKKRPSTQAPTDCCLRENELVACSLVSPSLCLGMQREPSPSSKLCSQGCCQDVE